MELTVKCPFDECSSKKKVKIPSYIFENKQFGTVKIQINRGIVCPEHQFVIFVDKKGKIRSYEKIDVQLTVAKPVQEEKVDAKSLNLRSIMQEIGDFATLNIIHAFLLDISVVIFTEEENERRRIAINEICKSLFPDLFEQKKPLKFMKREEFKRFTVQNLLAIDEKGYILSAPWEINKFEFEEELLKKALNSKDFAAQRVIFGQAVTSLVKRVEHVRDFIADKDSVYEEDIKANLQDSFMQKKVSDYDIDLIKELLKFRYLIDTSKIKIRSFDKLKESLW